jgi:hypothetical protein
VTVASKPKVAFWLNGNTSPGNYGCLFIQFFKKLEKRCAPKNKRAHTHTYIYNI